MIDPSKERLMPLSKAIGSVPPRRQNKRPHTSTLFRWATSGLRGVKLEVLRVGGTLCTSEPALHRFFKRLTIADRTLQEASHENDIDGPAPDVDQELDASGF